MDGASPTRLWASRGQGRGGKASCRLHLEKDVERCLSCHGYELFADVFEGPWMKLADALVECHLELRLHLMRVEVVTDLLWRRRG